MGLLGEGNKAADELPENKGGDTAAQDPTIDPSGHIRLQRQMLPEVP